MAANESRFDVLFAKINKWRKMYQCKVQKHKQTMLNYFKEIDHLQV